MSDRTTPHLIAKVQINDAGFPSFLFSQRPFVHWTEHGAEQEARKLSRQHECDFAVFKRTLTVGVEVDVQVKAIDSEELAGTLARVVQANNMHMSIESARYLVDTAIKQCGK